MSDANNESSSPAQPAPSFLTPRPGESDAELEARLLVGMDRLNRMATGVRAAIESGQPSEIDLSHLSAAQGDEVRKAFDHVSRAVWGEPLAWGRVGDAGGNAGSGGGRWTLTPPHAPPAEPEFCRACGQSLVLPGGQGNTRLRWGPTGRERGVNGWEHQCGIPQAGCSPADDPNPHPPGTPAHAADEADRIRYWKEVARRKAAEIAAAVTDDGHVFDGAAGCRLCGLARAAHEVIRAGGGVAWSCPGRGAALDSRASFPAAPWTVKAVPESFPGANNSGYSLTDAGGRVRVPFLASRVVADLIAAATRVADLWAADPSPDFSSLEAVP